MPYLYVLVAARHELSSKVPTSQRRILDRVFVHKARLRQGGVRRPQAEAAGVPHDEHGVFGPKLGEGTHPRVRVNFVGLELRRVVATPLADGQEVADGTHLVVGPAELDGCRDDDTAPRNDGEEHCSEKEGPHCPPRYVCSVARSATPFPLIKSHRGKSALRRRHTAGASGHPWSRGDGGRSGRGGAVRTCIFRSTDRACN